MWSSRSEPGTSGDALALAIKVAGKGPRGRRDLSVDEARDAALALLSGQATGSQFGALMMALRAKGEAPAEIAGFAQALSRAAPSLGSSSLPKLCDCAGPHDGRRSFMASLPAAVICAEAGLPSLLHGSAALSAKRGLSLLGLLQELDLECGAWNIERAGRDLASWGLAYVDVEAVVPGLAAMRPWRVEIGVRSVMNHAEKLLNFGLASCRMVGVHHASAIEKMGQVAAMGEGKIWLLQGEDGSEDLPVHKASSIYKAGSEAVQRHDIDPECLGLASPAPFQISLAEQAQAVLAVLSGSQEARYQAARKQTVLNAALRLWCADEVRELSQGVDLVHAILDKGRAWTRLRSWLGPQACREAA